MQHTISLQLFQFIFLVDESCGQSGEFNYRKNQSVFRVTAGYVVGLNWSSGCGSDNGNIGGTYIAP